jgi:hypothetical protein
VPTVANGFVLNRSRQEVWALLMDTDAYAQWNPGLIRIDGRFEEGAIITLHYAPMRRWMPRKYTVRVDACAVAEEVRWSGPLNQADRLFRASHYLRLFDAYDEGKTRLVHGENFDGILAPTLWPLLRPAVEEGHRRVNAALQARCGG